MRQIKLHLLVPITLRKGSLAMPVYQNCRLWKGSNYLGSQAPENDGDNPGPRHCQGRFPEFQIS